MIRYKIHITNGFCFAPYIIVDVQRGRHAYNEAIELGRSKSRLADFPQWEFRAEEIATYEN